jgi:hypothetical protein
MSFTCPRCGAVSHHPQDERHGYCGRCHDFTAVTMSVEELQYDVAELELIMRQVDAAPPDKRAELCARLMKDFLTERGFPLRKRGGSDA